MGQTATDALKGADILRTAPAQYTSTVAYPNNPVAQNLKSMAQVLFADLGTRIYYTQHGSFDTHSGELATHAKLWQEVSSAVGAFMDDVKEHDREDDVVLFIFSEFGRRIRDMVQAVTMALAAWPLSSAGRCRVGCTASILLKVGASVGGRFALQQRLPLHLCNAPGAVAGLGVRAYRQRPVRAVRLSQDVSSLDSTGPCRRRH